MDGLAQYLMQVHKNQMALVAGAVMGIALIPCVSSLSDDGIINAVPQSLRDGSLAIDATRSESSEEGGPAGRPAGDHWPPCCWPSPAQWARP